MKNKSKVLLICALLFGIISCTYSNAEASTVNLFINSKQVAFSDSLGYPTIKNDRTLVPIRIVSENLGFNVDWSKDTWDSGVQKVWINKGGKAIELEIGKSSGLVNGK